jgi:hypothetical protein
MKKHFRYFNLHRQAKRTAKRCRKPFWNNELKELWQNLCRKERLYLKAHGSDRNRIKHEFKAAQKLFDKTYRRTERRFHKEKLTELENLSTDDPNKFWKCIKNLGPKKKNEIPMEVYDENGDIVYETHRVLDTWKLEYSKLFCLRSAEGEFDDNFLESCKSDMPNVNTTYEVFEGLNENISESEIIKIVSKLKNNKAVGIDNLPNEVFKNQQANSLLLSLFNKMLQNCITPTLWRVAVIKPIPKSSLSDPRLPLQYRGISLLSTTYKMYSSILNWRLTKLAEENNLYCEEQNGFRKNRSCMDHIYSLTSIIRNRKNAKKSTFVCFVDFEKAFDRVDRDLLFYKLRKMKIGGNLLNSIRAIYTNCQACVNINKHCTDWFDTNFGVRQGDPLSPTLFGLYINDLANDINSCNSGISPGSKLNILLYADDIAMIADTEENLQNMIDRLFDWCKKWRLRVNIEKTNTVHFRNKSCPSSDFEFHYGSQRIKLVSKYKYLGVILTEHLDYSIIAETLADSGKRALGAIYSKFRQQKGLGCNVYSKLYHTGVAPILDYCSGIWGGNKHEKIDVVQNKAIRLFMGVHAYAPNLAIQGDMGWVSSRTRRRIEMLRYWNVLMNMCESRIPRKILLWETEKRGLNWASEIRNLLLDIGREDAFHNRQIINLNYVRNILCEKEKEVWKTNVNNVSKLRSYILFKKEMSLEPYVYKVINRAHRSILAQFRSGILPLKIETGRFTNIPIEFRLCLLCNSNSVEDEEHFLFHCSLYDHIRQAFFRKICLIYPMFSNLSFGDKCAVLMNENVVKDSASMIYSMYRLRQQKLYN